MSIKRTGGRKPTMGNWRASIWPRANMQYVNVVISMGICIWMHARYTMAGRWHARFGDMCTWFNPSSDPSRPCQSSYACQPPPTRSPLHIFHPYLFFLSFARTLHFHRLPPHFVGNLRAVFDFILERELPWKWYIFLNFCLLLTINCDSLYLGL